MQDDGTKPGLTQQLPSHFGKVEPAQPGLKLGQGLSWLKGQWDQLRASNEARAVKDAESRALRAEADAARLRNSTGNPFSG